MSLLCCVQLTRRSLEWLANELAGWRHLTGPRQRELSLASPPASTVKKILDPRLPRPHAHSRPRAHKQAHSILSDPLLAHAERPSTRHDNSAPARLPAATNVNHPQHHAAMSATSYGQNGPEAPVIKHEDREARANLTAILAHKKNTRHVAPTSRT